MADRNSLVDRLLQDHLNDVEGYSSDVYDDQKGIPTVGGGINLRSPSSTKAMDDLGIKSSDEESKQLFGDDDLERIKNNVIGQKKELLGSIQSQSFPNKQLKENQEAALLSLAYNSPQLLGPNLRQRLNENDDLGAMKEIILNSNKENSPGLQLRRIKEAELYGGPLDFQQMIKTLSPDEKKQVFDHLNNIENEEQRNTVLQKYAQFDPNYKRPLEKPQFFKMGNLLKGNENE